jgi:hypothetical protein
MSGETNYDYKIKARRSKEQDIIKKQKRKRFNDFDDSDFRQNKKHKVKRKATSNDVY